MRWTIVLSLLLVCLVYLSVAQDSFDDCCLSYGRKLHSKLQRRVVTFRKQVLDGGCNIAATIFTLRNGRIYCTDPNEKWVKDLQAALSKRRRSKAGKRHNKG